MQPENVLTFADFLSPLMMVFSQQYRVFWLYLLCSGALCLLVFKRENRAISQGFRFLYSKQLWLNRSVWLDFKILFFNHALWLIVFAPFFNFDGAVIGNLIYFFTTYLGPGNFIDAPEILISVFFTVLLFIADDFSRFFVHMLYHKVPWLWRFHAVHHSATLLTPFTLYRVHIVEMLINTCRSILVYAGLGAIFIYLSKGKFSGLELFGASVFSIAFNLAGANLRHSHIWLSWGKFEKWIMSPAQHQIHHSAKPEHFDKNYGVMIGLWDYWLGSWLGSSNQTVEKVGLGKSVKQSYWASLKGYY